MPDSEYSLMRNTHPDTVQYDDVAPIEIGRIVHVSHDEPVMLIFYDKYGYLQHKHRMSASVHTMPDGTRMPIIRVNKYYRDLLYEKPKIFLALAMHELGHIVNGDLERASADGVKSQQIRAERTASILNGKVVDEEIAADAFAVKQVGKSCMMNALDWMISMRRKRNDEIMEIAINEFELRKRAVRRL